MDHFYLNQLRILHCIDMCSRSLATCVVSDAGPSSAVLAFEEIWTAQLSSLEAVQGDQGFAHEEIMS